MTEDEAREQLKEFCSPRLDEFRPTVLKARTSYLVTWISTPTELMKALKLRDEDLENITQDEQLQLEILAAALAVADELDRRIPVPVPAS